MKARQLYESKANSNLFAQFKPDAKYAIRL